MRLTEPQKAVVRQPRIPIVVVNTIATGLVGSNTAPVCHLTGDDLRGRCLNDWIRRAFVIVAQFRECPRGELIGRREEDAESRLKFLVIIDRRRVRGFDQSHWRRKYRIVEIDVNPMMRTVADGVFRFMLPAGEKRVYLNTRGSACRHCDRREWSCT